MMKLIVLAVLMVVAVQKAYAGEEFRKMMAECKVSEKLSDTDGKNLKNRVRPPTREMKCLSTCIAEKMGLISNNQVSTEGTMKLVKKLPNTNEKMVQSATEVLAECKSVQDADR